VSVALLCAAAALGAATTVGVSALVRSDSRPKVTTVVEHAAQPPSPVALDSLVLHSVDGRTLNDAAYYLIKANEYARAIPFSRRAVRYSPRGSVTRGYATFNLGFALLEVGRCAEALPLLQRALKIEAPGARAFIRPRIEQARACLQGGASGPAPSQSSAATARFSRGP
jgi:tetratricopeptide (TPR) repeat protein